MSEDWRGDPDEETPQGRFLRRRWPRDSLWVLDIDQSIWAIDIEQGGLLIEWKHLAAKNKSWTRTREVAMLLNDGLRYRNLEPKFRAALFVYEFDRVGEIAAITATVCNVQNIVGFPHPLRFSEFDKWVMEQFVTRGRQAAA